MFKTIHVSRSHRIDRVGPEGPIGTNPRNAGLVSVLMQNGRFKEFPFGGFIDGDNVIGLPKLKIVDIVAICSDDEAQAAIMHIPRDHYVVGTYLERKVYVMTHQGAVRHYLRKDADQGVNNNVCSLF
ncbi:hypothetical protein KW447_12400 [Vibrio fluvialis]|nr:hypothetical protein [Vibrio fluvialis]